MNSDIRISTTFFSNRKTKKIRRKLGDHGVMCLVRLWTRVAIEKPCGVLSGWSDDDIELEANFDGKEGIFVSALIDVGFLDDNNGEYSLHNWAERQQWVVNAKGRSDRARLLRMARTHNKIYQQLVNDGCTGVTRKQYDKLTKIQRPVNATLTPAPDPVPVPVPDPLLSFPKDKKGKKKCATDAFRPSWISVDLWKELIASRKMKKLSESKLALTTFTNSLEKGVAAGYSIDVCVGEYVASSWKRFDHSWINKKDNNDGNKKNEHQQNIGTAAGYSDAENRDWTA